MEKNIIYQGDSLESIKQLPDESVDCVVTSPPYYGLRDYGTGEWVGGDPNCKHYRESKKSDKTITGHKRMQENESPVGDAIYKTVCPLCGAVRVDKQIGLEETPEQYIQRLVELFREIRRVLKKDGTIWVNIGDSYAAQRGGSYQPAESLAGGEHGRTKEGKKTNRGRGDCYNPTRNAEAIGLKHKDLIGIPWMLAFALRADGWYLRQDIIWHKPNPMPESVTDRCTKSHEYIFLLSKSEKYYFDAQSIQEECVDEAYSSRQNTEEKERSQTQGYSKAGGHRDNSGGFTKKSKNTQYDGQTPNSMHLRREAGLKDVVYTTRNKRDVWSVCVKPNKEAHFATYPPELITPCILAGCPEQGIVLDPFMGSGTTGIVARKLNRNYIGCELNQDYVEMAERRIWNEGENLFNQ